MDCPQHGKNRNASKTSFLNILKIVFYIIAPLPLIILPIMVALDLDPLSFIITTHNRLPKIINLLILLSRTVVAVNLSLEVLKSAAAFLGGGLLVVYSTSQAVTEIKRNVTLKVELDKVRTSHVIILFRQLQVWNVFTNDNYLISPYRH